MDFTLEPTKKKVSNSYGNGDNGKTMEVYLNINNPFIMSKEQMPSLNSMPYAVAESLNVEVPTIDNVTNVLKSKGFDGIIYSAGSNKVIIAFEPNQIKIRNQHQSHIKP